MLRAKLNVVGPSGELIRKGNEIPEDWDEEFRQSLLKGGAAEETEDDE